METGTAIALAAVVVAIVAGAFLYMRANRPAPSASGQIGAGVGSLVAGILNAAGVQ